MTRVVTKDTMDAYICCEHIHIGMAIEHNIRKKGFKLCCNDCYPDFLFKELRDYAYE